MPKGLAVLRWDDELGPIITTQSPKGMRIGLDPTTSMQIYGMVTLGETEESEKPGYTGLEFGDFNIGVYYGGLNRHRSGVPSMVFLILEPDEEPEVYRDALTEIGTKIFLNSDDDSYIKMVPKLSKQVSQLTRMNPEQRQASVIGEPVRRTILRTLTKDGTTKVSDLEQIVSDELGKSVDIELILRPLGKLGLIETGWVEGLDSEAVYLTRGLFILRTIPTETVRVMRQGTIPPEVSESFPEVTKESHADYISQLSEDTAKKLWSDAEKLVPFFLDFDSYGIIQALRSGPKPLEELLLSLEMTDKTLKKHLKRLKKNGIVMVASSDEGEYAFLKCDLKIRTVYPGWLIERTLKLFSESEITDKQAIQYLHILKEWHPNNLGASLL